MFNSAVFNAAPLNEGASRVKVVLASATLAVGVLSSSSQAEISVDRAGSVEAAGTATVADVYALSGPSVNHLPLAVGASIASLQSDISVDRAGAAEALAEADVEASAGVGPPASASPIAVGASSSSLQAYISVDRAGSADGLAGALLGAESGVGPPASASPIAVGASATSFQAEISVDRAGSAQLGVGGSVLVDEWIEYAGRATGYVTAFADGAWPRDLIYPAIGDAWASSEARAFADRAGIADGSVGAVGEAHGVRHTAFMLADVAGASFEAEPWRIQFGQADVEVKSGAYAQQRGVHFASADEVAGVQIDCDATVTFAGAKEFLAGVELWANPHVNDTQLGWIFGDVTSDGTVTSTLYIGSLGGTAVGLTDWHIKTAPQRSTGVREGHVFAYGEAGQWIHRYYRDPTYLDAGTDSEPFAHAIRAGVVEAAVGSSSDSVLGIRYALKVSDIDVGSSVRAYAWRIQPAEAEVQTSSYAEAVSGLMHRPSLSLDVGAQLSDSALRTAYADSYFDVGTSRVVELSVGSFRRGDVDLTAVADAVADSTVDNAGEATFDVQSAMDALARRYTYTNVEVGTGGIDLRAMSVRTMYLDLALGIGSASYAYMSINLHLPAPDERFIVVESEDRTMIVPDEDRLMEVA
ncbi:MAG: hypothetical protein ACOCTG_00810 [Bacteroidota bacterium]